MIHAGPGKYQVVRTQQTDLDLIFSLFDSAILYQEKNNYDLWPQFSRQLIETEIEEGRHWKITAGQDCVCVFSVLYSDAEIWKEKNEEPAVYLHRIAVHPLFKGRGMMHVIKAWAIGHAKENEKKHVRMDTWGNNENLRKYYIKCGFNYIGQQYLQEANGRPLHYGGAVLSLFQIEV
jgi:predicted GNAT family N-acyltransferase